MNLNEFKKNVFNWSTKCGIYEKLTWQSQLDLYYQEVIESHNAESEVELKMEMGDRVVCLINVFNMYDGDMPDRGLVKCTVDACIIERDFHTAIDIECENILAMGLKQDEVFNLTWDKIRVRRGMVIGSKWTKYESMTAQQKTVYYE